MAISCERNQYVIVYASANTENNGDTQIRFHISTFFIAVTVLRNHIIALYVYKSIRACD